MRETSHLRRMQMRGRGVIDGPFLNFSTQGLASFLKFRQFKGRIFLSVEFLKPEPGVYHRMDQDANEAIFVTGLT